MLCVTVWFASSTPEFKEWNSQTACNRRVEELRYENPNMCNPPEGSKCLDYFIYFLPVDYFKEAILARTNEEIQNGEEGEMTWGEGRYMGLCLLMATVAYGGDRCGYFSQDPISPWDGAPWWLNKYMAGGSSSRLLLP